MAASCAPASSRPARLHPRLQFRRLAALCASSSPAAGVVELSLARPGAGNALTRVAFAEIEQAFLGLEADSECLVILLTADGKDFCFGLDLTVHAPLLGGGGSGGSDAARRALALRRCKRGLISRRRGRALRCRPRTLGAGPSRLQNSDPRARRRAIASSAISVPPLPSRRPRPPHHPAQGSARARSRTPDRIRSRRPRSGRP